MPANSGAISGTVAHKHSAPSGDGGHLDEGVTGYSGGSLGEILSNDGTDIPVWSANTANPLIKVSKTFADIDTLEMDIYTLGEDSALVNVWADITSAFDLSTAVTIGDALDPNGFAEATDWTAGTGLTDATRGAYVTSFKTMLSTTGTTAIKAYDFNGSATPPVKDAQATINSSVAGTTLTNSGFTVAANSNRVLIVCAGVMNAAQNITGVTWNGTENFTREVVQDYAGSIRVEIWYLINPTATTADVVTTWGSSTPNKGTGVYSFYNVAQVNPIGVTNTDSGTSTITTGTLTPTTVGSMIAGVQVSAEQFPVVPATHALTAGWSDLLGTTGRAYGSQYDLTPTISASNDMFWTYSKSVDWAWCAVELKSATITSDTQGAVDFYLQVVD